MQRYAAIFVSVAMMTVAFAGAASADQTTEDREQIEELLEMRDRYDGNVDWENVETVSHDFTVPAGSTYAFTIDWATGDTEVEVLSVPLILGTGVGPNAGCISQAGGDTPWAQPEVGIEDCGSYTSISSSVSSTTLICVTDGDGCSADGLNFDFFDFGLFFVSCDGLALEHADWAGSGAQVGQTCEATQSGQSPADWDEYDSICGSAFGASAGLTACLHSAGSAAPAPPAP